MSVKAIQDYYNKIDNYKKYGGSTNESNIRRAFANLLEFYCNANNLVLIDELNLKESKKRPDGTIRNALGLDFGHWESKDEKDNLDIEILSKQKIGYPTFNIIFENSIDIVLIQENREILRGKIADERFLDRLLQAFVIFERKEIRDYRVAIEHFAQDIPNIVETLKKMIAQQQLSNNKFIEAFNDFWDVCKNSINPDISQESIIEMLIQHILTDEIFTSIFNESHFHRENIIASQLQKLIDTFFTRAIRKNTLSSIDNYYKAIKAEAARIVDHHQKQHFLKIVYENFYKAYNPKAADNLGIVYTPSEIVQFMIKSTDFLLEKHFNKGFKDKNVEILDPATGTGTFIVDLIDYIPSQYLEDKYKNEIHANEVAILPYYIANLNIEFTYQQKMKKYSPFNNIVFVDTLDNLGFDFKDKQATIEGFGFNAENIERIKNQNEKKISVIIGNPPYNANQQNENDNNKNRKYKYLDNRIKDTFIHHSKAQKTKVYDMYSRFFRWAMDRIHDDGIISFITNNSYLTSRTFDGFRKTISNEFDYVYVVDLGGNIRDLSGKDGIYLNEKHTIFGKSAMVGISIIFLVKTKKKIFDQCKINYIHPCDIRATRDEKLNWLKNNDFHEIKFERINPNFNEKWLNQVEENDWDSLIKIASKNAKLNRGNETIFEFYSLGVSTNRDNWVYDFNKKNLQNKIKFFINKYNELLKQKDKTWNTSIKWSRDLKLKFGRNIKLKFDKNKLNTINYRPFTEKEWYSEKILNDVLTENHYKIFGNNLDKENLTICFSGVGSSKSFQTLITSKVWSLDFLEKTQSIPLYLYDKSGENRKVNITDWSLEQFTTYYKDNQISKVDIFYYVYAVLHNPSYRNKYELNLKEDFPAIPFYDDFAKWTNWGRELADLHLNYENLEKYELKILNNEKEIENPKTKLKIDKTKGQIILDENTTIYGIPDKVWKYQFGNRSPIEWVADQYKEKKLDEEILEEQFNTYKFADYKEYFIDLIQKLTFVSVRTIEIMELMEEFTNKKFENN